MISWSRVCFTSFGIYLGCSGYIYMSFGIYLGCKFRFSLALVASVGVIATSPHHYYLIYMFFVFFAFFCLFFFFFFFVLFFCDVSLIVLESLFANRTIARGIVVARFRALFLVSSCSLAYYCAAWILLRFMITLLEKRGLVALICWLWAVKVPLLLKYFSEFIQKLTRSSTRHFQSIHQVSRLSFQQFLRYFADKVKMPKITKDRNSWSIFQNWFKS